MTHTQTGLPSFIVGQFGLHLSSFIVLHLSSFIVLPGFIYRPSFIVGQFHWFEWQQLQYLQRDSSFHGEEIQQQISSGLLPPHGPEPPEVLNSATWASLLLEGFGDILNAHKWNKTFQWLESEFDPLVLLSRKPSTQAPSERGK